MTRIFVCLVLSTFAAATFALADNPAPATQPATTRPMSDLMKDCMTQMEQCKTLIDKAYKAETAGQHDQATKNLSDAKTAMAQCMQSFTSIENSNSYVHNAVQSVNNKLGSINKIGGFFGGSQKTQTPSH